MFVLASRAAHKNPHAEVVACEIVCEMRVAQPLLSLSSPNAEQTVMLWGSSFKVSGV